jgi:hypothetical protein
MTLLSLDRLKTALAGNDSDGAPEKAAPQNPATLYECASCGTVYIAEEKQSCSECEASVRAVPNEHDLGLDLGR